MHHRKLALIRPHRFRADNFGYDGGKEEFICPAHPAVTFRGTKYLKTENGFRTERRMYECAA